MRWHFLEGQQHTWFLGDLDDDNVSALLFITVILGTLSFLRNNRLPQGTNWKAGPLFLGANHPTESWQWVITVILRTADSALSKYYLLLMNGPIDLQSYSAFECESHVRCSSDSVWWEIYLCTDKYPQSNKAEDGNCGTVAWTVMM